MGYKYEVESVRQCAGCDGSEHKIVRVEDGLTIAVFRRRDMAEDIAGQLNRRTRIIDRRPQVQTA